MSRAVFPLLDQGRKSREMREDPHPAGVPWAFVEPHHAQAMINHDQTLNRLADRGGLSPQEMLAVVEGWTLREVTIKRISDDDAIDRLHVKLTALGMDFTSRR